MIYAIQTEKTCLITKQVNGVKKMITRVVPMWVGIVSPFKDPLIMYTRSPNETILHTHEDILMVTEILHQKGIKHKVTQVEKTFKNFRTLLK
jgi:hypothetical protein